MSEVTVHWTWRMLDMPACLPRWEVRQDGAEKPREEARCDRKFEGD
jgi:hypothetical protein